MKTSVVIFPFDLFGSPGTGAGAQLLGDELREILADNERETVPTRADAYRGKVRLREFEFEKLADYQDWREQAQKAVQQAWQRKEFLLWLAGTLLLHAPRWNSVLSNIVRAA